MLFALGPWLRQDPAAGGPFMDLVTSQTAAGSKTFTDSLILSKAAQSGLAEINMQISVSDDPNASIVLANQQSTDGRYVPNWIYRGTGAGSAHLVLQNLFRCGPSMDVGSSSMVDHVFQGAPSTNVSNRTLYRILNNATALQTMSAFGGVTNTVLAQAGAAETLAQWNVSDSANTGIYMFNASAADATMSPNLRLVASGALGNIYQAVCSADSGSNYGVSFAVAGPGGAALATRPPMEFLNGPNRLADFTGPGSFRITQPGQGLRVAEGANCKQGVATLVAGTVTVANTSVTANSRIFLTAQDDSSTGALRVSARTAGTSFTITSSNAGDSGVVAYEIFEPS